MEIREIFRVVAKWLDNNGYKILRRSQENWLTGYQKANFHFGQSSTVGQTIMIGSLLTQLNLKRLNQAKIVKKSVSLFWILNMTISWCKHVHRLELPFKKKIVLRIYQLG